MSNFIYFEFIQLQKNYEDLKSRVLKAHDKKNLEELDEDRQLPLKLVGIVIEKLAKDIFINEITKSKIATAAYIYIKRKISDTYLISDPDHSVTHKNIDPAIGATLTNRLSPEEEKELYAMLKKFALDKKFISEIKIEKKDKKGFMNYITKLNIKTLYIPTDLLEFTMDLNQLIDPKLKKGTEVYNTEHERIRKLILLDSIRSFDKNELKHCETKISKRDAQYFGILAKGKHKGTLLFKNASDYERREEELEKTIKDECFHAIDNGTDGMNLKDEKDKQKYMDKYNVLFARKRIEHLDKEFKKGIDIYKEEANNRKERENTTFRFG